MSKQTPYEISDSLKECLREKNSFREVYLEPLKTYKITKMIAIGGMGELYLAKDQSNNNVALKVLRDDIAGEEFHRRFQREADVLSCLNHQNISRMIEFSHSVNKWFIVTEYVDGKNLQQISLKTSLSEYDAIVVLLQLAKALQYALSKQVIHRDIKPGNLMIERETYLAKIIDFGLGKILSSSDGITDPRSILGSPRYMAPEQIVNPSSVDHKADIYALGATLYFLVTRTNPYYQYKTLAEILKGKLKQSPIPANSINTGLHPEISRIIDKLMAINIQERYQTYGEIIQDLEEFLTNHTTKKAKPVSSDKSKKYRKKTMLFCAKKLGFLTVEETEFIHKMQLDLKQYFKSKPDAKLYSFNAVQMLYLTFCILEMIKKRKWLKTERLQRIMAKQIDIISKGNHFRLVVIDHFKNKETLKKLIDIFVERGIFTTEDKSVINSFLKTPEQNPELWGDTVLESQKPLEIEEEDTVTVAPNELNRGIDEELWEILKN